MTKLGLWRAARQVAPILWLLAALRCRCACRASVERARGGRRRGCRRHRGHPDLHRGIEALFSTFKLFRLDAEVDLNAANAELRLNGLAAVLVNRYLGSQEVGEGQVVIELVTDRADRTTVVLRPLEPLAPGHYVAMWRVLSADTHVVDGQFVFTVLPVD